ncbi:hypothetical protein MTR67_039727, partial [Solanum verrucosum]
IQYGSRRLSINLKFFIITCGTFERRGWCQKMTIESTHDLDFLLLLLLLFHLHVYGYVYLMLNCQQLEINFCGEMSIYSTDTTDIMRTLICKLTGLLLILSIHN